MDHVPENRLIEYIHQTLTDADRESIEQHLLACAGCRVQLDDLAALQRRIRTELTTHLLAAHPGGSMTFAALAPKMQRRRRIAAVAGGSRRLAVAAFTLLVLVAFSAGLILLFRGINPNTTDDQPSVIPAPQVVPGQEFEFVTEFTGPADDPLNKPTGLTVDSDGNLYVVDTRNFRILKFNDNGELLLTIGEEGSGPGQFNFIGSDTSPVTDVAVDSEGNLYVSDTGNARVQKFNANGEFLLAWGSRGSGNGQFTRPTGVGVDSDGNVYVMDGTAGRLQKFSAGGQFLTSWGSIGTRDGQFSTAEFLAVGPQNNIYTADFGMTRVQKFNPDGRFILRWGSVGTDDGQFAAPGGIAIDSNGVVYVTDGPFNPRVQVFDGVGNYLAQFGTQGSAPDQFLETFDVAVDNRGNIYVSDWDDDSIKKFRVK